MRYIFRLLFIGVGCYYSFCFATSNAHEFNATSCPNPTCWSIYLFEQGRARLLTHNSYLNYNPRFSPDGQWIIFTSQDKGTSFLYGLNLFALNSAPKRLTSGNSYEDEATISRDGKWLYYISTRDGAANIFKLPFHPDQIIAQAKAINLTPNSQTHSHPAVSPDGRWLIAAIEDAVNSTRRDIYLMPINGTHWQRLTDEHKWLGAPTWSYDGKFIYFFGLNNDVPQIYYMNLTTREITPLTPDNIPAAFPTVATKQRIAFAIRPKAKWIIASCDLSGNDYHQETPNDNNYFAPSFDLKSKRMLVYGDAK